jgi:hypothetical protein
MPTPFTHLKAAQDLLRDPVIPELIRAALNAERSAFLLGSIAADARVSSGIERADTHFYRYDEPMDQRAWRVMLARHPSLQTPGSASQRVFLAGYAAHLAMDEIWTLDLLREHFFEAVWQDHRFRFFMLTVLLTWADERDHALLENWHAPVLEAAQPVSWVPFMSDNDLLEWRDFIYEQLITGSQTLQVLGERARRTPEEYRAVLDSPERLQADLWDKVPTAVIEQVESRMYTFAREQLLAYWAESS